MYSMATFNASSKIPTLDDPKTEQHLKMDASVCLAKAAKRQKKEQLCNGQQKRVKYLSPNASDAGTLPKELELSKWY